MENLLNLLKLKRKMAVCLVSYLPPFLNSEKLQPTRLYVLRFGGYLNSINYLAGSQGRKITSEKHSLVFYLIGELVFLSQRIKQFTYGMFIPRMVIRGYTFQGSRSNNAYLYNNTHYVTYYVTFPKHLALLNLYSLKAENVKKC